MQEADKKLILIVDDEDDIRTFLSTLLEDSGFRVQTAADGDEAIARISQQVPDLISLDLVMPGKSGIKLLYELRRNRTWSRVPILIVSGHTNDDLGSGDFCDIMSGKVLSGPRSYLEKPVDPRTYVNSVRRQLGIRSDESTAAAAPPDIDLRREAAKLLDSADEQTIKRMLAILGGER